MYNWAGGGGSSNLLPTSTPLTVAASATLDLSGGSQQVASLSGSGLLTTSSTTSPAVFTVGDSSSTTFSGQVTDSSLTGGTAGNLSLIKVGTGTLTLAGSDTYTGGTFVEDGTLAITTASALPAGSSLTVDAGGTFVFDPSISGSQIIGGAVVARSVSAVPEPGTLALLAAALAMGLGVWRRRRA